ncbi:hypothetical protein [Spirosoma koreense]
MILDKEVIYKLSGNPSFVNKKRGFALIKRQPPRQSHPKEKYLGLADFDHIPLSATLSQLLDRFCTHTTANPDFAIRDQIDYTYQSLALEGSSLTLPAGAPGLGFDAESAYG